MRLSSPSPSSLLPASRALWLGLAALGLGAALWAHGPIAQWADYHAFADQRAWLGVPNAANVLSNLSFLAVGAWALWRLSTAGTTSPSIRAWRLFGAALVGTAVGSSVYHWAPSNATLVFDRLPIAWACAALLCAFLAERVSARWCSLRALGAALAVATLSVAVWWASDGAGQGDLRLYLYVQFLPMLLVPLGLWLRLPMTATSATPANAWWTVLACYALAKLMEMADHAVFGAIAAVSGHTLKHLLAAAGAALLLRAVVRARQAGAVSSGSRR